jgi:hypothetical protein
MIEHYLIFLVFTYFPAYYLTHKLWGEKEDLGGLPVLTSAIWPICLVIYLFVLTLDKLSTTDHKGN